MTQQFLAAHPNDYYAHGYLGYIYLQMGDLAHAGEEYSRSYELWPSEDTQKHLERSESGSKVKPPSRIKPNQPLEPTAGRSAAKSEG